VGVALQCCIGGHHKGFKVSRINERYFHFSVDGNKVGHFIHGLKDRVWPDFICHFHLFNGRFNGFKHFESQWHADERLETIASRSPMAIRVDKASIMHSMGSDPASSKELLKFGLIPLVSMDFNDNHSHEASCSSMPPPARATPADCPKIMHPSLGNNQCLIDTQEHLLLIGKFRFPYNTFTHNCHNVSSLWRSNTLHSTRPGHLCCPRPTSWIYRGHDMTIKNLLILSIVGAFYVPNVYNGATIKIIAMQGLSS